MKNIIFFFLIVICFDCYSFEVKKIDNVNSSQKFEIKKSSLDDDLSLLGKKAFDLKTISEICPVNVSPWFCLTTRTFYSVLCPYQSDFCDFYEIYDDFLKTQSQKKKNDLFQKAKRLKTIILEMSLPESFLISLGELYSDMKTKAKYGLIVKSSISINSNVINIPNDIFKAYSEQKKFFDIALSVKKIWASIFDENALNFFIKNKIDIRDVSMGVIIQKMINPINSFKISLNEKNLKKIKDEKLLKFLDKINTFSKKHQLSDINIVIGYDQQNKIYLLGSKIKGFINNQDCKSTWKLDSFKKKSFARIAQFAVVIHDKKVLMLKQNIFPCNWRPPGGGLRKNEGLIKGLKREIMEDTSLEIKSIKLIKAWKGTHNIDDSVLSLIYACKVDDPKVLLSNEYSTYQWIKIEDLNKISIQTPFDLVSWIDLILKVHLKD